MKRAAPLLAVVLMGCSQNAILELTIVFPGAPDARTFAQFQARDAGERPSFAQNWGAGEDPSPFMLALSASSDTVSVVSPDSTENDLNIRLTFCGEPACREPSMLIGEAWFTVEHPFYPGERTFLTLTVPDVPMGIPAGTTVINRCDVRGCVDEGDLRSGYCDDTMPNLPHLCEL